MPEITIEIGDRDFEVVCKAGEEEFLRSAAAMLDTEAQTLKDVLGRIPESRMLLMAGLMLADKTASLEDRLATTERSAEDGALASEIKAEVDALKKNVATKDAEIDTVQQSVATKDAEIDALNQSVTEKDESIAELQTNLDAALAAMGRMLEVVEAKGAA